jgi:signal transduction histidine kinase
MSLRSRVALLFGLSLTGFAVTVRAVAPLEAGQALVVFLAAGMLATIWLGLEGWVLRPLSRIDQSVVTNNPGLVRIRSDEPAEFGRVARFMGSSFELRDSLQRERAERATAESTRSEIDTALQLNIAERSRLGRDLHDGIIPSLYAAGMGLAGIDALLRPEQTEVAMRLAQSRAALNETIHDLRNVLTGLEPEALKLRTFSDAVAALLETLKGIRPFTSRVEIDDTLVARLGQAQRVHALQITREAVSNALRHGEANRINVTFRQQDGRLEFEVSDDGRGFEPGVQPSGNGLANFAARARELDTELRIRSEPGGGTSIRLTFCKPTL